MLNFHSFLQPFHSLLVDSFVSIAATGASIEVISETNISDNIFIFITASIAAVLLFCVGNEFITRAKAELRLRVQEKRSRGGENNKKYFFKTHSFRRPIPVAQRPLCNYFILLSVLSLLLSSAHASCEGKIDMVICLDGSGSMGSSYPKVQQFAKNVIDKFTISSSNTRVAVLRYVIFKKE